MYSASNILNQRSVEKSKYNHHNEGQKTNYKVSRTEKKNEAEVLKNQSDK